MDATVRRIQRFPVKGLSPEDLAHVDLAAGQGVPGDRMYGFARHGSGFDPGNPKPLPKDRFVVLLTQAGLTGLKTAFDPATRALSIRSGAQDHRFDMADAGGQQDAANWLATHLVLNDPAPPQFVSATPHRFTDVSVVSPQMMNAVSLLNLASVRDLSEKLGVEIDPARFRANIELDGLPPWWEMEYLGAVLQGGDLRLRTIKRTQRCAATEVNPRTAERDLRLPYLLRKELGHMDMGVYAEVETAGSLALGDTLSARVE